MAQTCADSLLDWKEKNVGSIGKGKKECMRKGIHKVIAKVKGPLRS